MNTTKNQEVSFKKSYMDRMLSHLLLAQDICVIDIETSGFSRNKGGEILKVSAFIYNVSEHNIKR